MKILRLILVAVAALTMTAQAQNIGTIDVGDWDNATTYNGSYFDMAPTNFYLAHTGAQMIYTPDLLNDMDGKPLVHITQLQFMFHNESFEEIIRNVKIYFQETDATAFNVVEGVKQFFDIGELVYEGQENLDMIDSYGEDVLVNFTLDLPFLYEPGMSLIVTMVFDAEDNDNCTMGSDYAPFYTSGVSGLAMTYTDNQTSFLDFTHGDDFPDATSILGCGTNVNLPLTRIAYTYGEEPYLMESCLAPYAAFMFPSEIEAEVILQNLEEGATVDYEVYRDNQLIKKSSFTGERDTTIVVGPGYYEVLAVAKKEGKLDSATSGVFFVISNPGGLSQRGDVDWSSDVSIADVTALISYLLTGDATHISLENSNCDQDNEISINDVTTLINYLLTGYWWPE